MDVKCDQCGTEYEFDDDRLFKEAVTVKCASCGFIFKVRRDEPAEASRPSPAAAKKAGAAWMVRQVNGNILTFKELTTLQKWIVERKVSREDEISKSGETWKRLGTIAELASFFQVVDTAAQAHQAPPSSGPPAPPPPQLPPMMQPGMFGGAAVQVAGMPQLPTNLPPGTLMVQQVPGGPFVPAQITGSYGAYAYPQAAGAFPGAPYPPGAYPQHYPPPPGAYPLPQTDPSLYPAGMPPMPAASLPPPPAPVAAPAVPVAPAPLPRVPVASSADPEELLDDDDPVLKWQRARRRNTIIGVLVVLLVGGATTTWLLAPQLVEDLLGPYLGRPSAAATAALGRARDAFWGGNTRALRRCVTESDAALQAAPNHPEALALRAMCMGYLGAGLSEEKAEVAARMALPATPAAELDKLKARGAELTTQETEQFKAAFESARAAVAQGPQNMSAALSVAAYYAVRAAPAEAKPYVERAAAALPAQDPWLQLVQTELKAADPAGRAGALEDVAAMAQVPAMRVMGLYRAAAWSVAARAPGAQAAVDALLRADPQHERGNAMAAHLKALAAPPPPAPVVVDAGPPPEEKKPEEHKPPEEKKPEETPPADDKGEKKGGKMTFDRLLAAAERAKDKGQCGRASGMFMKAQEMEPERAEPHVGLGWCFIDQEKFTAAMGEFDRAAQLNPSYAEAYVGLGEVYKYRGDKLNAVRNYQKYLTILPDGPEAELARNNINELKTK
ncbi:MAG: zinc-ribbon domain-containing protein [Deltaproteobacteria bacterium]|nr:zinc-ribbon domain-containing protein [Deltaproteobacteria bacterium]